MDGATHLEQLPVEQMVPYAKNARTHDEGQVAAITQSIKDFGFNNPILLDKDGNIVAGHGRLLAAHNLGLETVPAVRLEHLTEAQARAYRLADNRLAEMSGWDFGLLAEEITDLQSEGFNANDLGWEDHELEVLTQADFSPEAPGDLPTKDEGSQAHSVAFSAEQWELVQPAVKAAKAKYGDGLSNAQALAQLAQDWVTQEGGV